jgi:hypothetical protein
VNKLQSTCYIVTILWFSTQLWNAWKISSALSKIKSQEALEQLLRNPKYVLFFLITFVMFLITMQSFLFFALQWICPSYAVYAPSGYKPLIKSADARVAFMYIFGFITVVCLTLFSICYFKIIKLLTRN